VHELAPNLASLAAPLLSSVFLVPLGWRGIVTALGLVCAGVAAVFAIFDRDSQLRGQRPQLQLYRDILSKRFVWVMIALFSLGIGSNLGVYSMLSLYLVAERGYAQASADTLLTVSRLSTPLCVIAAGWAADRFGRKRVIATALLVTGLTTCLLGVAHSSWLAPLLFLQPMFAVSFFPPAFALLSSHGTTSTRNLIVSVTIPFAAVIGTGIMPSLIGVAGDVASLGLGLSLWGVIIVSGAVLLRKV
jgi:NNP family nitrate/nitrite transporter-like MFS transporter